MAVDLSVFQNQKSLIDQLQLQKEFELKKAIAQQALAKGAQGGDLPAPLQLANEYQKRIAAGDTDGANLIMQFAKTQDRGLQVMPDGTFAQLPGYAQAVGGIGAVKKGMEQQASKSVDLVMNPQIAMGESNAKNQSEANYAIPIETNKAAGQLAGQINADKTKKATNANTTLDILSEIDKPDANGKSLLDKATGSTLGAAYAGGKQVFGKSDESTQANAELTLYGKTLINNVPRMEGPQSDADRRNYEEQAGRIADPRVPAGDKRASIKAIRTLNNKYAAYNGGQAQQSGQPLEVTVRPSPEEARAELIRRGLIK